ncbi:MAG: type II secretion system protein GspL [Gammaproteobacteria bacterium]|nr:type II secretion system protein GspL [Gammaproteobacteria bacterium]
MQNQLFIRFDEKEPQTVQWLEYSDMGEQTGQINSGTLDDAAVVAQNHQRIIILIPSTQLLLTSAHIPTKNRQRIAKALPYSIEEQMVDDVENMHFAIGEHSDDGQVHTAVIPHATMQKWQKELLEAGIYPQTMTPDLLLIPYTIGDWTFFTEGQTTLVRTGLQSGFLIDNDNLKTVINLALDETEDDKKPETIHVIQCQDEVDITAAFKDLPVKLNHVTRTEPPLQMMALTYSEQRGSFNLLQGPYSRREQMGKFWKPWLPALTILLILLASGAITTMIDYSRLSQEKSAFQQEIEQIYKKTFPDAKNIVNPPVQMERHLVDLRRKLGQGSGGFLKLLDQVAPILKETETLDLRRLGYKEGQLTLQIEIKDLAKLDQLKAKLAQKQGIVVDLQSASAGAKKVEARLLIKEA